MSRMSKLTYARVIELLDFDPATGVFVWKVARSNRVKVGSRAGVFHGASGGRYISIDNEKFMSHRLAFFYVNGRWPTTVRLKIFARFRAWSSPTSAAPLRPTRAAIPA